MKLPKYTDLGSFLSRKVVRIVLDTKTTLSPPLPLSLSRNPGIPTILM